MSNDEYNEPLRLANERARLKDKAVMQRIEQELEAREISSDFRPASDFVDDACNTDSGNSDDLGNAIHEQFQKKEGLKIMSLILKGKAAVSINEGKYEGVIVRLESREKPFHYIDVFIETKTKTGNVELKYGAPASLSPTSKLGKLVKVLTGQEIEKDKEYDLAALLVGKRVTFMSMNEDTERGTFARIVENSIKLLVV